MSLTKWSRFSGQRAPATCSEANLLVSGSGSLPSLFPVQPRRQTSLTSLPASPPTSLTRGPTTSGASFVTTCLSLWASRASLFPSAGLLRPSITLAASTIPTSQSGQGLETHSMMDNLRLAPYMRPARQARSNVLGRTDNSGQGGGGHTHRASTATTGATRRRRRFRGSSR